MGLFNRNKKTEKGEKIIADSVLYELTDKKELLGQFMHEPNFRGFKRISISNFHYPAALGNLEKLTKTKPLKKSKGTNGGDLLDLKGSEIALYRSETVQERKPAIMLCIDGLFIGANIVESDRAKAAFDALQDGRVSAAHVEIEFGGEVYNVYLMLNNC